MVYANPPAAMTIRTPRLLSIHVFLGGALAVINEGALGHVLFRWVWMPYPRHKDGQQDNLSPLHAWFLFFSRHGRFRQVNS